MTCTCTAVFLYSLFLMTRVAARHNFALLSFCTVSRCRDYNSVGCTAELLLRRRSEVVLFSAQCVSLKLLLCFRF